MAWLRIAALAAVAFTSALAQTPYYLHEGDRVVFYGDSITDQRLYTTFVETYTVTRFPTLDVTFVHSGWGGDRVTGGGGGKIDERLQRDVFPYHPTVVTVMLGMNDAGYKPFDQATFDTFANGYLHIVEATRKADPGVRMTLIKPSPFDDVTQQPKFEGGYNAVLIRYGNYLQRLAAQQKVDFADLNTPVVEDLKRAYQADPALAQKLIPDRVHPGPAGHLLMAAALLRDWHAPAVVTSVGIDAAGGKVLNQQNTHISNLKGLSWTQQDTALPLPIDWNDPGIRLAVNSSDILQTLDQELLTVRGLNPGAYSLKIDGANVGSFSAAELEAGVNLAKVMTPMMLQALEVHKWTKKRTDVHNARWRQLQVPYQDVLSPNKQAAMEALDNFDRELAQGQHAAAKPAVHNYELSLRP